MATEDSTEPMKGWQQGMGSWGDLNGEEGHRPVVVGVKSVEQSPRESIAVQPQSHNLLG
jgi:hypothetical protein